jgi:hypothetical protein
MALCAVWSVPAASATLPRGPANAHYALDLDWDQERWRLSGTESVTFENTLADPLSTVWLRLWANGPAGCDAPAATVEVTSGGSAGTLATGCTALPILLTQPLAPGAIATVGLRFAIAVPPTNDRFGRSAGSAMLGAVVPILAVRDATGYHVSEPYTGNGESYYSLTSRWTVALAIPVGVDAVTTGTETTPRTVLPGGGSRLHVAADARDFAMAIGPFTTRRSRVVDGVRIRVVATRATASEASATLERAAAALAAFTTWYGRYDGDELDVVAWNAPGGMEWPGLVMSGPGTIEHEVAHQWWYSMVGNDQYDEPWLDESWAVFSERRLDRGPRFGATTCSSTDPLVGYGNASLRDSMHRFDAYTSQYDAVYAGGACTLWDLYRAIGRARFDAAARDLFKRFDGGVETTDDVIASWRRHAPATFDLDRFLRRARLVVPARRDLIDLVPRIAAPWKPGTSGPFALDVRLGGSPPMAIDLVTSASRFDRTTLSRLATRPGIGLGTATFNARLAGQADAKATILTGACQGGAGDWHVAIAGVACLPVTVAMRPSGRLELSIATAGAAPLEPIGVTLRLADTVDVDGTVSRLVRRAPAHRTVVRSTVRVTACAPGVRPEPCTTGGQVRTRSITEIVGVRRRSAAEASGRSPAATTRGRSSARGTWPRDLRRAADRRRYPPPSPHEPRRSHGR